MLSDPSRITLEMYRAYLSEIGKGWLCEVNGEVVGFCIASSKDASIWALFVKQEEEGKGFGTRLLKLATRWLFDTGAPSISLSTEANTRADKFYERLGWRRGEIKSDGEICYTLDRPEEASGTSEPPRSTGGLTRRCT
ncbi:MAG: GNAT family N-acetyltransferase, partial [Acidobacteriota bacterium]|nr:GNAT family N-acetyltransferase [Acidobacteriota bacterium]